MTLLGHDLRAAVSDVIGGLRLIDHGTLNDATKLQLERVRASGEILARLLEEGLSLMLGEDDFAATHPANLQMSRFLYDVEMRWSGRASENGLGFAITAAPSIPAVLTLDRIALERILSNILSNAIKYTDKGQVSLDIRMADTGALRFTVTDQGPGFSDEALRRLFQYQGRPDGAGKPGDGLGMHITKNMTGRLGGEISVENLSGGGARVTLDLPPETWTISVPDAELPLPDLSRTKILIAEDNETNQIIIGHMLAKMGAQFETAQDGIQAMQWLERESFDLALIDIEMPRMTGIEVIKSLRTKAAPLGQIPVIAITAYVLRANRDAIYAAGADAILAKPLAGPETFGQAIANVLARKPGTEASHSIAIDEKTEINRESFDHLMEIAGPASARELLDRLHKDLRRTEHGLISALAAADAASVRAETHVLIALAGAVGATRLQALAQALNVAAHRRDTASFAAMGHDALAQLDRLIHFVAQERVIRGTVA
ncbi:MAG: response regulator [Paracoccaceae bacterium]